MICFEVRVNGEPLCTAGVDNAAVLTAILSWAHHSPGGRPYFQVGGLTGGAEEEQEFIDWVENQDLSPGDEITIRIVEQAWADPPVKRLLAKEARAKRDEGGG
jgi:hypothetical protein